MNRQLGALRRPRPEAYTAPVSPLVPTTPGRTRRPPTSGAVAFWYLVFCVGLVGLAATGQGVLFAVWLLAGWGLRAGTRAAA